MDLLLALKVVVGHVLLTFLVDHAVQAVYQILDHVAYQIADRLV